jgi:mRNA interferase MazF
MNVVQRGEVYEVRPDPSIGREIQKERPCVIVSSNIFNIHAGLVVVCPITEGVGLEANIIHVPISNGEGGATKDCIVLCEQIKAIDENRIGDKRGNLRSESMQKIDKGLRQILSLQ